MKCIIFIPGLKVLKVLATIPSSPQPPLHASLARNKSGKQMLTAFNITAREIFNTSCGSEMLYEKSIQWQRERTIRAYGIIIPCDFLALFLSANVKTSSFFIGSLSEICPLKTMGLLAVNRGECEINRKLHDLNGFIKGICHFLFARHFLWF